MIMGTTKMIDIAELVKEDVGRWVVYDVGFKKQKGKIKSWNDNFIFVVYMCDHNWDRFQDYTGCCTNPQDLTFTTKGEI